MHPIRTSRSYLRAIPPFLTYQILSNIFFLGYASLLNRAADWLIRSTGHVAISTGDFSFLFTSWQGILILAIVLVTLYLYVGFDVNAKVALAGRWVRDEDVSMRGILATAFGSLKSLLSPGGFLLVIYFSILSPLVGFGYTISLTENLTIPTFISSVIDATPLYHALFIALVIVIVLIGLANTFSIHGVVLDDLSLRDSARQSFDIMKSHWWNYLLRMLLFWLGLVAIGLAVLALQGLIGMLLLGGAIEYLGSSLDNMMTVEGTRFVLLLIITLVTSLILVLIAMSTPFILIKMTKLYEEYTRGEVPEIQGRKSRLTPLLWLSAPGIPALCVLFSWVGTLNFDAIFPQTYDVKVIAHRACGNEGYENTAEGLATAEAAGAWGAEIDIQRTADGAYVVNHDDNFARVAGDSHKPSELTLEQVRQLKVTANPADPTGPGVPVSTYEEMLDGALAHNLVLFVELKGATADHQMVDDAVRIARERGALDNCVFISLKYDLIDYLEKNYHDVKGGYLAFGSYGETQNLNCDYLALEEQATSPLLIANVHGAGKSYLVWTVNTEDEQEKFLCTGADAIITDNITQAARIKDEINHRGDVERVMSVVSTWF